MERHLKLRNQPDPSSTSPSSPSFSLVYMYQGLSNNNNDDNNNCLKNSRVSLFGLRKLCGGEEIKSLLNITPILVIEVNLLL